MYTVFALDFLIASHFDGQGQKTCHKLLLLNVLIFFWGKYEYNITKYNYD